MSYNDNEARTSNLETESHRYITYKLGVGVNK